MKHNFLFIKIGLMAFIAVFLILICTSGNYADKPMEQIASVLSQAEGMDGLKAGAAGDLRRYYNLEEEDLEGFMLCLPASPMDADELLVVKMKDEQQASAVEQAILQRQASQKASFEGYGAQQTALLNGYVLEIKGRYAFYAVSPYAQGWQSLFSEIIRA
ncbi:DUF4358 domain-containing protein [Christensenellaceae bacterium NSJ-44]|uniref:DUF4358 domain-containing protein n=1 Tax=Luoshenia tenuis TaxID=2763654 RepID=A0A926D2E1_9FIRM|nr:DUF4358 domain-containing protein [Luoshenia tenuis]MBC8530023.1 DUF4358 domain-containing protein [Luoshenia tenuis]